MFGEAAHQDPSPCRSPSPSEDTRAAPAKKMNLCIETEDSFSSLLDLAANNDLEWFKRSIERDRAAIDEIGLWYGRQKGSSQMVLEPRTPLMVAATYGSVDVLKLILSLSSADVNRTCSPDRSTALHCAASGGSVNAAEAVRELILAGADPEALDASGRRPADVIVVSPNLPEMKSAVAELLCAGPRAAERGQLRVSTASSNSNSNSPPLSLSPENGSPSSSSESAGSSPMTAMVKAQEAVVMMSEMKKEYPIDPSLPDIKNSMYATDEFRMFSFKVRPCSRAYSHDWTECPFVHPGENARRRDPRKFHYSCVPCPDFRKGTCRRGDLCEYAHGVFECWLHPAQYRTRLCKDGTSCMRRVCFFAHTSDELRPLYVSTGSAVPSPRSSAAAAAMDMAAAMSLLPASPSSVSVMSMSPSPFTPPMSPSTTLPWPQPNVPTLHLPGSNLHSSRLRSSLNARDIPPASSDEFDMLQDFGAHHQLLTEFSCFSPRAARMGSSAGNRPARSKTLTPSNLDELFSAEISSPRFSDQVASASSMFSPSHKSAILNQFQQQQSLLSPINTTGVFSPKSGDQHMPAHHSLLPASFGLSSPGRMSPRGVEPHSMNARMAALAMREEQQMMQLLSSRDLGSGASAANSWSKWSSPTGKLDWAVNSDELAGKLRRSSSFELGSGSEDPDVSWVQSLVKESPPELKEKSSAATPIHTAVPSSSDASNPNSNSQLDPSLDHTVLGAWIEHMQLDQLVA